MNKESKTNFERLEKFLKYKKIVEEFFARLNELAIEYVENGGELKDLVLTDGASRRQLCVSPVELIRSFPDVDEESFFDKKIKGIPALVSLLGDEEMKEFIAVKSYKTLKLKKEVKKKERDGILDLVTGKKR